MAVPAMGFDQLAEVVSRPSTRPDQHRRSPRHTGSKRKDEGYDVARASFPVHTDDDTEETADLSHEDILTARDAG